MISNRTFGRGLRALRKRVGYSLPGLALKTGLSKSVLSKIENGTGNPTIETIAKLLRAFPSRTFPTLIRDIFTLGSR